MEYYEGNNQWSSLPHQSPIYLQEQKPLGRTSSYPLQQSQQLQHCLSEPLVLPKSSFTSFPPPGSAQASPKDICHLNLSRLSSAPQAQFSAALNSPSSNSTLRLPGLRHEFQPNTNMLHFNSPNMQNQWSKHAGLLHGDQSILVNDIMQHQYRNSLLPPQLISPQQQQRLKFSVQPSLGHMSGMQSHIYNTFPSPSHLNKYGLPGKRESKSKSGQKGRNFAPRSSHQSSDASNHRSDSSVLQFRSKYMTAEDIESILKTQHAATHGNDPYADDFYHQNRLAKKAAETRSKHRFCPSHPREKSSRSRKSTDSQPHLRIDALGRVSFSQSAGLALFLQLSLPHLLVEKVA